MNYGHYGRDLLLELKRADGGLPKYNDRLVSGALQDLRLHVQALQDQVEATKVSDGTKLPVQVRPSILLQNAAVLRNKRCLLAYHVARVSMMEEAYWNSTVGEISDKLCPAETAFLDDFGKLVQSYTKQCGLSRDDLRAHSMPPLPDDRVQVRVLQELGSIVLDSGASVNLTAGSTHYLLWSDVEEYVRDGVVRVLQGEEQ